MMKESHILLLEDAPTDAELIIRELRRAQLPFQVRRVETQETFLAELREFGPDVIISDFSLSQFNALDALRLLKELSLEIPFILCTGSLNEELAIECMKEGATDYILKTSLKRLPSAVRNALENSEARRARAEANAALHESEARYRQLFDCNPLPAWVFDSETLQFLAVNEKAVSHYGYTREEFLGMTIVDIRPPEDISRLLDILNEDDFNERTIREVRHRKKDGTIISVEVNAQAIEFDGRKAELVMVNDITEQYRAEVERQRLEDQLRQSQKMESIGTLTGGVAHDFNNLLTVIIGNAQLALNRIPAGDPMQERLVEVEKAANRAAVLTRQLLAFSRRQRLERRTININETISEVTKLLQRIIGADVAVSTKFGADVSPVFADPAQIEQVVMNLGVNARDAMPAGGHLSIETSNVELDETYCRHYPELKPGRYVQIAVSDTGTGMDEATKDRIFEPFFTTKQIGQGTGLGLSMAYGIIKQHEGHINVYSEPGQGTTFKIYLAAVDLPVGAEPQHAQPSLPRASETVLIAEDEEQLRELARNILEAMGYTALVARDGVEAVEIFAENRERIDLLLFDVVMPRMSGTEAYEQIRQMGCRVPVVFMTGYSAETQQNKIVAKLNATIIQKPYSATSLNRQIREVLNSAAGELNSEG